jgi:hypothetical protein
MKRSNLLLAVSAGVVAACSTGEAPAEVDGALAAPSLDGTKFNKLTL